MKPTPQEELDLRNRVRTVFSYYISFAYGMGVTSSDSIAIRVMRSYRRFTEGEISMIELVKDNRWVLERDPYDTTILAEFEKYHKIPPPSKPDE